MANVMPPGESIREELTKRGLSQEDLAHILGRTKSRVHELIAGKQELSPEIAVELETAFGVPAEAWLQREAAYRLSLRAAEAADVKIMSRLYELGPVKEMQKRGWISETDSTAELEREVLGFYGLSNIDEQPQIAGAMRKSAPAIDLTPAQQAWVFRVRNVAAKIPAVPFDSSRVAECRSTLRKLVAYSAHTAKVPKVLAHFGIRFVVVEPLSGGKIDGVATWLDKNTPAIGLSMRYERIDNFWHNVFHEVSHVEHHDESIDTEMGDDVSTDAKPAFERRADEEAASNLIPKSELTAFIRLYGPLYTSALINQLANKLKVHPGVIVGQLHHVGAAGYSKFRDMLVKVRDTVVAAAVTDGWGHKIDPRILK